MAPVVTFDAGMTLIELDLDFLARRLATRGVHRDPAALRAAAPRAWRRYDDRVDAGEPHGRLWHDLLSEIIGAPDPAVVDWLWQQQPTANLFRAPIPDMVELARALRAQGVLTAVLSNSEGGLAGLLAEVGIADAFEIIVDSGRVGLEKPDPAIFRHTLTQLGLAADTPAIHIGDSWSADVAGALASGWRAIWYGRRAVSVDDPRVACAHDAVQAAAALARFG
jgi:HAD superfamily hydrolase (TIGR01509 family)